METVIRVAIIYFFVLLCMRIIGKRELGQLSPFELVLLMLIPDIAQQGMIRQDYSITNALIGIGTIFSLTFLNGIATYLSDRANKVIEGNPTVLFHEGKFFQEVLDKERLHPGEVISAMHRSGLERLEQVKWIILETDGEMTFIPKRPGEHAPASATEEKAQVA